MAKISVIIPAYNAETTLRTAVESILSQQVPELEIIIVNDGSTDGTDRLCHALASEYPCIHVITQKNAGICAARNRGMEAASGEYITFCDDDDLFWQGALRLLLQTAEDTRADLVRGGYELLRQRPDGTFAEQPHPAGSPCTIALGCGGSYGAFWRTAARSLYGTPSTAARRCWGCASMSGAATGWRTLSLTPQPTGASARRSTSRRSSTAILRVRRAPPARTRRRHFWAASGRWSHGWRLNSTPPSAGAARRSCRPSGRTAAHRPSPF